MFLWAAYRVTRFEYGQGIANETYEIDRAGKLTDTHNWHSTLTKVRSKRGESWKQTELHRTLAVEQFHLNCVHLSVMNAHERRIGCCAGWFETFPERFIFTVLSFVQGLIIHGSFTTDQPVLPIVCNYFRESDGLV